SELASPAVHALGGYGVSEERACEPRSPRPRRLGVAMGQDVDIHEFTREDRTRYRNKVRQCLYVFARMLAESSYDDQGSLTVLEIEVNLVDTNADPAMRNARVLDVIADPAFVTELGQFNIEINVPPRDLAGDGLLRFEEQVRTSLNAAEERASG